MQAVMSQDTVPQDHAKGLSLQSGESWRRWPLIWGGFCVCVCVLFLFIYLKIIYFNWRIVTLQYCGGFCNTSWISHGCTCDPPILNPPPTSLPTPSPSVVQSTGFECPAWCIGLALVIYFTYGNIHVSSLKMYKFIYFNWRLITLQYCIGFAIHQYESAMGVHMLPILNPAPTSLPIHPSGSSLCTSPEHPV